MSSKKFQALYKLQNLKDEEDFTKGDFTYFVVRSNKAMKKFKGDVEAAIQKIFGLDPYKVDFTVERKGNAYHIGFKKRYAQDLPTWQKLTEYVRNLA